MKVGPGLLPTASSQQNGGGLHTVQVLLGQRVVLRPVPQGNGGQQALPMG